MLQFIGLKLLISNFALKHAVYLWKILPNQQTKLSPLELVSGSRVPDYTHLQRLHVWACPALVLDPKLLVWKETSQVVSTISPGLLYRLFYLPSVNREPYYELANWVNLQCQLVHDDWFRTVSNSLSSSLSSTLWGRLISTGYERAAYGISVAKDTWQDSETSIFRLLSGGGREMNASNQSVNDEVDLENSDNLLPGGEGIKSPEGANTLSLEQASTPIPEGACTPSPEGASTPSPE